VFACGLFKEQVQSKGTQRLDITWFHSSPMRPVASEGILLRQTISPKTSTERYPRHCFAVWISLPMVVVNLSSPVFRQTELQHTGMA
jgi:hypothetical protein